MLTCINGAGGKTRASPAPRQLQHGLEAAFRSVAKFERSAVPLGNRARDRQSQTGASFAGGTRGVRAIVRLEHTVELVFRDARTLVDHANLHPRCVVVD